MVTPYAINSLGNVLGSHWFRDLKSFGKGERKRFALMTFYGAIGSGDVLSSDGLGERLVIFCISASFDNTICRDGSRDFLVKLYAAIGSGHVLLSDRFGNQPFLKNIRTVVVVF